VKNRTKRFIKLTAILVTLVMLAGVLPLFPTVAAEDTWADELYAVATSNHAQALWDNKTASLEKKYPTQMTMLNSDASSAGVKASDLGTNDRLNVMYRIAVSGLSAAGDDIVSKLNEAYNASDVLQMMRVYENAIPQRRLASMQSLLDYADTYVFVRNKALGGSHYAYTEGLSDDTGGPEGNESNFNPGSQLCLLTLKKGGTGIETEERVLLDVPNGVVRDPCVSDDGSRVVFSMKNDNKDDYHLYELDLATLSARQLTSGSGISDIEPSYLPNGNIVFESSRCVQTVDCWKTPVSNLYVCGPDGENIRRVGYDQVTTSYTSVTEDGRVIYTRWDYNDRTQMYVQGLFQMNPDGTNQTELYGNNSSFPTTLLHARSIDGTATKYIAIASGHHTYQGGKLVIVDVDENRDGKEAITYVFPAEGEDYGDNVDTQKQSGSIFRYPYALSETQFLVSYAQEGWSGSRGDTPFGIYYMTTSGTKELLVAASGNMGAAQIVPVRSRSVFNRASMVNYSKSTGTYYMGNVYAGEAMEGVKEGEAKYLRVVALDYRAAAIGTNNSNNSAINAGGTAHTPIAIANGTWDVKVPLGIVKIEEDGSCLFEVPSETSLYFQVLNADYELIATMRSWSTLQPNEFYSCVGCHEDNNTAPAASSTRSLAMQNGVQKIVPEDWMTAEAGYTAYDPYTSRVGFSFNNVIQPILDKNCISCHNNTAVSKSLVEGMLSYSDLDKGDLSAYICDYESIETENLLGTEALLDTMTGGWKYTFTDPGDEWYNKSTASWKTGSAPFGDRSTDKTVWNGNNNDIWLVHDFTATAAQTSKAVYLRLFHDDDVEVYLNGEKVYASGGYLSKYTIYKIVGLKLKAGNNHLAVHVKQQTGGRAADCGVYVSKTEAVGKKSETDTKGLFSLEGKLIQGKTEKRYFSLSYLILTQSTRVGSELRGKANNAWTVWTSCQSACEVQKAYSVGGSKGKLITMLQEGHGNLSASEIHAFETWIDLSVPYAGTYDEQVTWSNYEISYYQKMLAKRTAQEEIDRASKNAIAAS